jgi:hypothetical protein
MTLYKLFKKEVQGELSKHYPSGKSILCEEDIINLPPPLQNYFRICGYIGKSRVVNSYISWNNTYLKFGNRWSKINCVQYNSAAEPCRIVYMSSKIFSLIPFEGRDAYVNGHGNMLIKLMKFINIQDQKGFEMDTSALVTVLAEVILLPEYALCGYINWQPIDDFKTKAEISYNGVKASGIFNFSEKGEIISFETNDRYKSGPDGTNIKMRWYITADEYTSFNDIKYPRYLTANWDTPDGELKYFKGEINKIETNIKQITFQESF